MKKLKEADILKACQDLLDAERIPWYRMNSGKIILKNGNGSRRCIKLNPEGTPDLLFHWRWEVANFWQWKIVWLEVKKPGEYPTDAQVDFMDKAQKRGEKWMLIHDVKQLQDWLKEMRK